MNLFLVLFDELSSSETVHFGIFFKIEILWAYVLNSIFALLWLKNSQLCKFYKLSKKGG